MTDRRTDQPSKSLPPYILYTLPLTPYPVPPYSLVLVRYSFTSIQSPPPPSSSASSHSIISPPTYLPPFTSLDSSSVAASRFYRSGISVHHPYISYLHTCIAYILTTHIVLPYRIGIPLSPLQSRTYSAARHHRISILPHHA